MKFEVFFDSYVHDFMLCDVGREDCTVIAILAHGTSGITSVGLNAVALVKPRYR